MICKQAGWSRPIEKGSKVGPFHAGRLWPKEKQKKEGRRDNSISMPCCSVNRLLTPFARRQDEKHRAGTHSINSRQIEFSWGPVGHPTQTKKQPLVWDIAVIRKFFFRLEMKGCSRIESQYHVKEEQKVARDQDKSKRLVLIGNYENQKGWLLRAKLRPLVEVLWARPIRSQDFIWPVQWYL